MKADKKNKLKEKMIKISSLSLENKKIAVKENKVTRFQT